jgi:hypothetical protein
VLLRLLFEHTVCTQAADTDSMATGAQGVFAMSLLSAIFVTVTYIAQLLSDHEETKLYACLKAFG